MAAEGLQQEDQELVARFVASRDEEAFRLLFRRHTPRLFALAHRLMGSRPGEAEDVVQDAWQRAAGRMARFEWRSALSTWLGAIVINCARERLRRRSPEAVDPATLDGLARPVAASEPPIDLDRAIATLPDGYREVFVLHDIEGHTHEEIGALLGVSAGTSKSQLFHARRALRAHLAPRPSSGTDHHDR